MITIKEIKEYNKELESYKKRAREIEIERGYIEKDIDKLCKELTEELGKEVTQENVTELCKEYEAMIENTIVSGREIFERVKAEGEYAGGIE